MNPEPPCKEGYEVGGEDKKKPGCCYKRICLLLRRVKT